MLIKDDWQNYVTNEKTRIEFKSNGEELYLIFNGEKILSVKINEGNYDNQSDYAKKLIDFQGLLDSESHSLKGKLRCTS